MKKTITILTISPLVLFSKAVKVDEILTDAKKFKLDISLSYSNINKKQNLIAPITYQTTNGDFISIPTFLGNSKTNQDYINYGLNLKYGFSKNLEVFTNLNFFTSDTHIHDNKFNSKSDKGFNNLNIGLIYQVKKENEKPSLLVGTSMNLIERVKFSNNHKKDLNFKSYSFFVTSYYTIDPIVFLLKTNYRLNLKKRSKNETIDSADILTISPNIYFAINPYTSLNWGVSYQYKGKDKINEDIVSNSGSSVGYLFGVNYEISSKYNLNFDYEKKDTQDYSSNNINLTLSYKF